MEKKIPKLFSNYLLIYLTFLLLLSVVFMSKTYDLETNNAIAEWIINYQGSFGRRGLLGEIFVQISLLTDIKLKSIVLYFLIIIHFIYYYLVYLTFKQIKFDFIFILCFCSPLFIIFPLTELEALGRKDILIPLFFIIFCYLYQRFNFYRLSLFLLLAYSSLLLIHEVSIFYLPYFYFFLILKFDLFDVKNYFIIIFISIFFLLIVYLLSQSTHSQLDINKMCNFLMNSLETKCGLGAFVLDRSLKDNIRELSGISFIDIARGIWIFFLGYLGLILLIFKTGYKKANNILFKNFKPASLVFLFFLPTLTPFFIAVDWGRWFNLSYTMSLLFYCFCYNNNFFNFTNNSFSKKLKKISNIKSLSFTLIFLICFSWNPKAVYHEDIGSIPLYRIVTKVVKY
tara:strand:- start:3634 stop:4827 length:1194 start_codon:yes stop_codon:yes gene_type:complete